MTHIAYLPPVSGICLWRYSGFIPDPDGCFDFSLIPLGNPTIITGGTDVAYVSI